MNGESATVDVVQQHWRLPALSVAQVRKIWCRTHRARGGGPHSFRVRGVRPLDDWDEVKEDAESFGHLSS